MSDSIDPYAHDPEREAKRLAGIVSSMEEGYRKHRAQDDARNLAFYRGDFWENEGNGVTGDLFRQENRCASRNEIFPVVDSIVSSLAMDLPQVEALDQRALSYQTPTRAQTSTHTGRRIASALNWFAEQDEMDRLVQELVLHAEIFEAGGCVKTFWSPTTSRVAWRIKMPWEFHIDPAAKRVQDATWTFERFVLHFDDFAERVRSDIYNRPKREIRADTWPRDLIAAEREWDPEQILRAQGLREYIGLVEFWDYRRNLLYHIHPETQSILSRTPMPYSRPYDLLIFHSGVGRVRGVSDVGLMAPTQRDINEMKEARREIVYRLPRRMMIDRKMFKDDAEFKRFAESRSWEPHLADMPGDATTFEGHVFVTPAMDSSFDFNVYAREDVEHIRYLGGAGDWKRGGSVRNIRTAAQANMEDAAVDERLQVRARRVAAVVRSMFTRGLEAFRWAIAHPEASRIDLGAIVEATQADITPEAFATEVLTESPRFRLLPFSPAMEDKNVRRESLARIIGGIATIPQAAEVVEWRNTLREVFDGYNLPPECIKPPPPPPPRAPPPAPVLAAPAQGAPPNGAPVDPRALLAALAAAGGPGGPEIPEG